jgi:release factor glutamine methyltransferase
VTEPVLSAAQPGAVPDDQSALVALGLWLRQESYNFATVTPATHAIVQASRGPSARGLRDAFGWNLPFAPSLLPSGLLQTLQAHGFIVRAPDGRCLSRIRFATLGPLLLAHSAYPTDGPQSVFMGPDTYRFTAFCERELRAARWDRPAAARLLDVGCGTGAAGLFMARARGDVSALTLSDVNPTAVRFARANAALNSVAATAIEGSYYDAVEGPFEVILCNPPYLCDEGRRLYRDGCGDLGTEVAVRMVEGGIPRLARGGRLLLYSGAPVVEGVDQLAARLAPVLAESGLEVRYGEIDPDVFGDELAGAAYAGVERIAAVGMSVRRSLSAC